LSLYQQIIYGKDVTKVLKMRW